MLDAGWMKNLEVVTESAAITELLHVLTSPRAPGSLAFLAVMDVLVGALRRREVVMGTDGKARSWSIACVPTRQVMGSHIESNRLAASRRGRRR